jgi:hypothetical protein
MREIRLSGSEGGGTELLGSPYPYQENSWGGAVCRNEREPPRHKAVASCACDVVEPAGCKSLSRSGLDLVTKRNCVAVRRGGKQREVND